MIYRKIATILAATLAMSFYSCKKEKGGSASFDFDFSKGKEGWQSFFSEYPVANETNYELVFDESGLPLPLTPKRAIRVSGNNHSDDLLSFIYRKVSGLRPNTTYLATFTVEIASNVPTNSVGIGGSPDLMLGAGGISSAPASIPDPQNIYRPNFESRLQSGLANHVMDTVGRIGVSSVNGGYMPVTLSNTGSPIALRTNAAGELWLMVGTDSGFEGKTTLYYSGIRVQLITM